MFSISLSECVVVDDLNKLSHYNSEKLVHQGICCWKWACCMCRLQFISMFVPMLVHDVSL